MAFYTLRHSSSESLVSELMQKTTKTLVNTKVKIVYIFKISVSSYLIVKYIMSGINFASTCEEESVPSSLS